MSARAVSLLNPLQREVAEDREHNLLLLAGAGTGKTSTLAHRVAGLLTSGAAAPEEILCLTFTNRACREMLERIEAIAGETASGVAVRTIHSFCAQLLRETPQGLTDIGRDFTVCDQPDCMELIREVVFEVTGRMIGDQPVHILQSFIGLVKDAMLAAPGGDSGRAAARVFAERRREAERLCVDRQYRFDPKFFRFLAKYGASIVRLYNLKLTSDNMLDFSDLLIRANDALSDPETAALWSGRYRFVHVDEVQDVSLAEYRLITRLCGNAVTLLCGDFNQTIYQWRGSDPGALTARFQAEFSPKTVEFVENYRSTPALREVARSFLRNAAEAPGSAHPLGANPDVEVREFETMADEVGWIHSAIEELGLEDLSKVAVITRTNRACTDVCNLLKTRRLTAREPIRFMLADEIRLFKRAEIKDVLSALSVAANPHDAESLKRMLTRLAAGVGAATIQAVISEYKAGLGVALPDFVDPRTLRTGDFFGPLRDAREAGRVVVFDVESTGTDVCADEIIQMAAVRLGPDGKVCGRFERFLKPQKPVGASERVHGFSDAFLAERGMEPAAALGEFLDFAGDAVIVGHNVGFDMSITANSLARHAVGRAFGNPWYDTLDLARRFLKDLPNHKLGTVAAALGAENAPSHDAMDDILATADVLGLLCEKYLDPREEPRRACYRKYLTRFGTAAETVAELREAARTLDAPELVKAVIERFKLEKTYEGEPEKLANLLLFRDFAEDFTDRRPPPERQLEALLEMTALSASELDRMTSSANKVAVITAHQSKGCEFDYVFLPVLQEGVFPTFQAVRDGDVREEKRVFYVSITRAKKKLFLSWAHYNSNQYPAKPSRFLDLLG